MFDPAVIEGIVSRSCEEQGVPRVPSVEVLDRVARIQVLAEKRQAGERAVAS